MTDLEPSAWGVLHEWVEDGEVNGYVFGPLLSEQQAQLAMDSIGCDCARKVIRLVYPPFVKVTVRDKPAMEFPDTGTPLLPHLIH